jgi:glycosyltransferase involved in cell wall biosynthesis
VLMSCQIPSFSSVYGVLFRVRFCIVGSNRVRITFVLPVVSMSGGNRVVAVYARALTRMGHMVKLVSPPPKRTALKQKAQSWLKGNGWPVYSKYRQTHLDDSEVDHRMLDRWRPVVDDDVPDSDVVIATWWETAEWVNALSSKKGAKVYFVQGHEVFPYLPVDRCRATYRLALHKVVVSDWLRQIMKSEYGDEVIDVVPNSVDKDQFRAEHRSRQKVPSVGFLYSGASIKGLDITLAALSIVRQQNPSLRLVSFGSVKPTAKLPLPGGTEFHHAPQQDNIRSLYGGCDVWVTTSRSEGFNLSAMEAMACRTPVVSTRTGWQVEAIKSGWNGYLVEIDDVAGVADGICSILSQSDEDWKTMSSNAYSTIAESSWSASAAMFEQALRHACQRAKRGEIAGKCEC